MPTTTRGEVPAKRRLPSSERREQILEVAQDAFVRAGYRGTTALEIGVAADVSEKLVLKHFGNKEGLFRAAVVEPLLTLLISANEEARALMAGAPGDDSPDDAFVRVHRFLSTWAAVVRENAPLFFAFLAELRDFPDVRERVAELFAQQVAESTEILSVWMTHGGFRPFNPRVAFLTALGAATVAALASDDSEAFLDEYMNITLLGVLSDDRRAAALAEMT